MRSASGRSMRARCSDSPSAPACFVVQQIATAGRASDAEEVTIVLVSDRRMAALHKQFMDIDGPTDVLTFQHGEIFISVETAEQNAAEFSTSVDEEIRLYIVHGLLHLRGLR
jgi:probable rRNA maturation factor